MYFTFLCNFFKFSLWLYSLSSSNPPRFSPTSLPPTPCSFSVSQKQQNKTKQTKKPYQIITTRHTKTMECIFALVNYSWAYILLWTVVKKHMKTNHFPSSSTYQLQTASQLWVLFVSTSYFPSWDIVWLEFYRSCVCCQSLCGFIYVSTVVSARFCFLGVSHHLWLFSTLNLSIYSSTKIPKPWVEGLMKTSHLELSTPKSPTLLWVSVLIAIYRNKKLLWWGLSDSGLWAQQ